MIPKLARKILILYAENARFLGNIAFWAAKSSHDREMLKKALERVLMASETRADIVVGPPVAQNKKLSALENDTNFHFFVPPGPASADPKNRKFCARNQIWKTPLDGFTPNRFQSLSTVISTVEKLSSAPLDTFMIYFLDSTFGLSEMSKFHAPPGRPSGTTFLQKSLKRGIFAVFRFAF